MTTTVAPTSTTAAPPQGVQFQWPTGSGWRLETRGSGSSIVESGDGTATCTVGGTETAKYARIRHRLDDAPRTGPFRLVVDVEIPSGFHDAQDSWMRLLTTDNFGIAEDADEWRVGFVIDVQGRPKLMSLHENHESNHLTLWAADDMIAPGRHTIDLWLDPDPVAGAWHLAIDGVTVGERDATPTVPASVSGPETAVTRAGGCIDGASNQIEPVSVILHGVSFTTDAPAP